MTGMPSGVCKVRPVNTVDFHATQWNGLAITDIEWMAATFGWKFKYGVEDPTTLVINGRNGRRYSVRPGQWVVALGTNGSLRVCSDRTFQRDYRKAD